MALLEQGCWTRWPAEVPLQPQPFCDHLLLDSFKWIIKMLFINSHTFWPNMKYRNLPWKVMSANEVFYRKNALFDYEDPPYKYLFRKSSKICCVGKLCNFFDASTCSWYCCWQNICTITLDKFQNLLSTCSSGVWCTLKAGTDSMPIVLCFGQL